MKLSPEETATQEATIEKHKTRMVKTLQKETEQLLDLIKQRASIRQQVSKFEASIQDIDSEIEKLTLESEKQEKEILENLSRGIKPEFSSIARENKDKIKDLKFWRTELEDKILELKGLLDPVQRNIKDRWHHAVYAAMEPFKKEIRQTALDAKALIRGAELAGRELEASFELPPWRSGESPLKFPYSMELQWKVEPREA